jgi:membrane protein YdbS with pleckstrin-like domain
MYMLFKDLALRVMKAPTRPPDPPAGSHDAVQVYRASPRYLTYRLLGFWLVFAASWMIPWSLVAGGVVAAEPPLVALGIGLMPLLVVIQLCSYFAVRIDYDMRYYIVTDRSLRVREGAFIVKENTISYANIQNIRVVQGPLLRYFGIWHLKVDTAGGGSGQKGQHGQGGHSVQMAGIVNAHDVRTLIQKRLRTRGTSAGLGDPDDIDEDAARSMGAGPGLTEALRELKRATAALRVSAETRSV